MATLISCRLPSSCLRKKQKRIKRKAEVRAVSLPINRGQAAPVKAVDSKVEERLVQVKVKEPLAARIQEREKAGGADSSIAVRRELNRTKKVIFSRQQMLPAK